MTRWLEVMALCSCIAACSGAEEEPFPGNPLLLGVSPSRMYSAFGGSHAYAVIPSVPWVADDPQMAATLVWRADDRLVRMDGFDSIPAATKLTTRAAGSALVEVKGVFFGDPFGLRARLDIAKANDEDWERGDARFHGGPRTSLAAMLATMERPDFQAAAKACGTSELPQVLPQDSACASCHDSSSAAAAVPITPLQLAGYSDEELIAVITQGQLPSSASFSTELLRDDCVFSKLHAYTVDDEDKPGLVLKLRSLPAQVGKPIDVNALRAEGEP